MAAVGDRRSRWGRRCREVTVDDLRHVFWTNSAVARFVNNDVWPGFALFHAARAFELHLPLKLAIAQCLLNCFGDSPTATLATVRLLAKQNRAAGAGCRSRKLRWRNREERRGRILGRQLPKARPIRTGRCNPDLICPELYPRRHRRTLEAGAGRADARRSPRHR